jgi:hypothetical protein
MFIKKRLQSFVYSLWKCCWNTTFRIIFKIINNFPITYPFWILLLERCNCLCNKLFGCNELCSWNFRIFYNLLGRLLDFFFWSSYVTRFSYYFLILFSLWCIFFILDSPFLSVLSCFEIVFFVVVTLVGHI